MADSGLDQTLVSQLLTQLNAIEVMLSAYQPELQPLLAERLQGFVSTLQAFKQQAADQEDTLVPLELLRRVDQGGVLDEYVREAYAGATHDNQLVKGRAEALEQLRGRLLERAADAFPDAAATYREVAAAKAVPAPEGGQAAADR